jgi:hypothetical protein
MATPTLTFNSSTGSDTTRSGSASPSTPSSGTAASYAGSVFTLDGSPDLSGVATDGTAVIWVQTSTGRQFFTINAKDNTLKTVTVDDAPAGTATGLTWGLGGKRATWDNASSRKLFSADAKAGWIIQTETNQTVTTSYLQCTSGGTEQNPIIIQSNNTTVRTITQTANDNVIATSGNPSSWVLRYLKFATSNGAHNTYLLDLEAIYNVLFKCDIGDSGTKAGAGIYSTSDLTLYNCEVHHTKTFRGLYVAAGAVNALGCSFHDNAEHGIYYQGGQLLIMFSQVWNNTSEGIHWPQNGPIILVNCTVHNNGSDGLNAGAASGVGFANPATCIRNNNFTKNGGYGINAVSGTTNNMLTEDYNNFGTGALANTSGDVNNFTKGPNDIAVDPQYANASAGDFTPSNTATQVAFPTSIP